MQPGASADISSLPLSVSTERSFVFAHNYIRRYGSNSPALKPSGEGPCLPNRAELAWEPSWLENPAGRHSPYLGERWWQPQPHTRFSAELEPSWSLLAFLGVCCLSPPSQGLCTCCFPCLEYHPPPSIFWLTPTHPLDFSSAITSSWLSILPAQCLLCVCVHEPPCFPCLSLDHAVLSLVHETMGSLGHRESCSECLLRV